MQLKTRISLFIVVIIALHAVPVLSYERGRQTRWPFLSWTMYAKSFPPGPITMATDASLRPPPAEGKKR